MGDNDEDGPPSGEEMESVERSGQPPFFFKDIRVTGTDLLSVPWLDLIKAEDKEEIEYYSTALFAAAKEAEKAGDLLKQQVLVLLAGASSMYYDQADLAEPLKPMFIGGGSRSTALVDFEDPHLDPITEAYTQISDNEMRARLADILWLRRKDHNAARVAIAAYLAQAKALMDPAEWVHGFQRLQRAMQIAAALGKNSAEREAVVKYGLEVLANLDGTDPLYLTRSIIDLLLDYKAGDPAVLAGYAEKAALNAEQRKDGMVAADYWALVSQCKAKAGDNAGAATAMIKEGEAQISVGEAMAGNPGLAAEHWIEQGLLSLRQAGAPKEDQEALMKRLHDLQKERLGNLGKIETSVPIDPQLIAHLDKAKGREFQDALSFWAAQARPTTMEQLKKMVMDKGTNSPVASLLATTILREDGKTDFVLQPMPMDGQPSEELLKQHMWRMAEMARGITAWMANYVRLIINEEHSWTDGCLDWLLNDNLFVPRGREPIFERGIRAGIDGDYLVAAHLLIPQVENSFRHVLNQNGFVTTCLRQDGTQDEFPINKIVESEAFAKVFGDDPAFELRGLLAERAGSNMRNNVAHGLLSANSFYGASSIVMTPLTLWLLFHGLTGKKDTAE